MAVLQPQWSAPANVKALVTTRSGGASKAPFASFNTGLHVGDDENAVRENRAHLEDLAHDCQLQWLNQVHGTEVAILNGHSAQTLEADAAYSRVKGLACIVQTADCLPILLCDKEGFQVAAVHAGWRSLAGGIISKTFNVFEPGSQLLAFLAPAISQKYFEVGEEVYEAFAIWARRHNIKASALAAQFISGEPGKFFADLYGLASLELASLGVQDIFGGQYCTFEDQDRFYSYRRDGKTGRMATLIWLAP